MHSKLLWYIYNTCQDVLVTKHEYKSDVITIAYIVIEELPWWDQI